MNEDRIEQWAEEEYRSNQDVIEDLSTEQVYTLIQKTDYSLVFVCE